MPQLVDGKWVKGDVAASEMKDGAFHREPTRFHSWVTPDGRSGPDGQPALAAEKGRYRLFVSYVCPWASRTIAMRNLKGLETIVGLTVADPVLGEDGWTYDQPVNAGVRVGEIRYHHQLYTASDPHYTGKVSVPVLWDMKEGRIVNNESADIIRILNSAFDDLTGNRLDFYPAALRTEIDRWNEPIYARVNNGVYRAGFAKTQAAYDEAVFGLFDMLDELERHLAQNRYLAGAYLTEADIRLFVTLIRFDAAYHGVFKCNIRRIEDYPSLSNYLREIYQWPGIRESVRIDQIKRGYYGIRHVNPTGIVPAGPVLDFDRPHDRNRLRGLGVFGN
ncbi:MULTISPECIES: glutathione S-transferase family protein [unclassified Sinorhizobium]|uniref:glutathione S-transferase family protein n=1 Tax=unclassified Sinorhizobium TaxID=2613772 RepID=UPI0024C383DA|nr:MULTISPECIES: glutathione S-transferase family protein [unclassified Sinorhizobium]MDK1375527.1 glutathione S-transferase family protein [Sinorhizobium sp. 6-70]MDK1478471.1 glutathione S-transferase family protein [Sinorhizobium sp. 6-117]